MILEGVSFNASLKNTNQALGIDLANFIKINFPRRKILEFGCGFGRIISQLQKSVPTASFSALGLRIVPS